MAHKTMVINIDYDDETKKMNADFEGNFDKDDLVTLVSNLHEHVLKEFMTSPADIDVHLFGIRSRLQKEDSNLLAINYGNDGVSDVRKLGNSSPRMDLSAIETSYLNMAKATGVTPREITNRFIELQKIYIDNYGKKQNDRK
ncbi:hypothetical protein [Ligilactobacillus equi]|uniref:50S ribosomal protein L15 n=1 Tax=Ligilactobacillus equi DPC 6820 TaxID=1392007 RepID=V7HX38_9LACO|nr:hypothetical protein [Ligilactobacillus equi]ETA73778.1 50S ribosomal protein L15 [Ligilactobacillus equi DPC 6820]